MQNEQAVVDQIVQNLAFEIEAEPKDKTLRSSSISQNTPLNVKIKVRKKEDVETQHHVSSIVDNQAKRVPHKVRLVNSDQTIMTFDLFLESEFEKEPVQKSRRNFFSTLKPGICLGAEDDDEYAYMPNSTYTADVTEPSATTRSGDALKQNFTLKKNTGKSHTTGTTNHKWLFGKCKPGGCLDPPFSEDKYAYKPSPSSKHEKNVVDEDTKIEKKRKLRDKANLTKPKESKVKKDDSVLNLYQVDSISTHSSHLITYPHKTSSDIKIDDDRSVKSEDRPRKSFNEHSEPYFIPPKRIQRPKEKESLRSKPRSSEDILTQREGSFIMPFPILIPVLIPTGSSNCEPVRPTTPSTSTTLNNTDDSLMEPLMLRTKTSTSEVHPDTSDLVNFSLNDTANKIKLPEEKPELLPVDKMNDIIKDIKNPLRTKDSPIKLPEAKPELLLDDKVKDIVKGIKNPLRTKDSQIKLPEAKPELFPDDKVNDIIKEIKNPLRTKNSPIKLPEEKPELLPDDKVKYIIKGIKNPLRTKNSPIELPEAKPELLPDDKVNDIFKGIKNPLRTKDSPIKLPEKEPELLPDDKVNDIIKGIKNPLRTKDSPIKLPEEKPELLPDDKVNDIVKEAKSPKRTKDFPNIPLMIPLPVPKNLNESELNCDVAKPDEISQEGEIINRNEFKINELHPTESKTFLGSKSDSPVQSFLLLGSKPNNENEIAPTKESIITPVTSSDNLNDITETENKLGINNEKSEVTSTQSENLGVVPEHHSLIPVSTDITDKLTDTHGDAITKDLDVEEPHHLLRSSMSIHDIQSAALRQMTNGGGNDLPKKIDSLESILDHDEDDSDHILKELHYDSPGTNPITENDNFITAPVMIEDIYPKSPIMRPKLNSTLHDIQELNVLKEYVNDIHEEDHGNDVTDEIKLAAYVADTLTDNTNNNLPVIKSTDFIYDVPEVIPVITVREKTLPFDNQDVLGKDRKKYPAKTISEPPKETGDKEKKSDDSNKNNNERSTVLPDIPPTSKPKSNLKKNRISVNLGFHSYLNEKNERVVKTFEPGNSPKRLPNDIVTLIKSHIKPSHELRVPVDLERDLSIQMIKPDRNVRVSLDDTRLESTVETDGIKPSAKEPVIQTSEFNVNPSVSTSGTKLKKTYVVENVKRSLAKQISDDPVHENTIKTNGIKSNTAKQTVDVDTKRVVPKPSEKSKNNAKKGAPDNKVKDLYEHELVPLQTLIKSLKSEIDSLASQQVMLRDKLYGAKMPKIPRLAHTNKKCVSCLKK